MSDIDSAIGQKYQGQNVKIFGIHPGETPQQVADFIDQTGVSFPIVADQRTLNLLAFPRGVGYPYPRDVVIDKHGVIRSIKNSFDVVEMDALIGRLLAEP